MMTRAQHLRALFRCLVYYAVRIIHVEQNGDDAQRHASTFLITEFESILVAIEELRVLWRMEDLDLRVVSERGPARFTAAVQP